MPMNLGAVFEGSHDGILAVNGDVVYHLCGMGGIDI